MFEGKKVLLRSVELTDLDDILEHFNTIDLRKFISTPIPYSREEEEQWIRKTWEERQKGVAYHFAIVKKDTREFLGTCGLFDINTITRTAELGIAIHAKKNWGKGFGTDTMTVLLNIGFKFLNLHRIELRVFEFNKRAIRTYEKVGFKTVGKLRQAHFSDGKYHNVILMDILQDEWFSRESK